MTDKNLEIEKKSKDDDDVVIPATQSPPSTTLARKSPMVDGDSSKTFPENILPKPRSKAFNRTVENLKDSERNRSFSMISSPSIMSTKPKQDLPSTSTRSSNELKPKIHLTKEDALFDELKKSVDIKNPTKLAKEQSTPPKAKKISNRSHQIEEELQNSPIKKFKPNPEWSSLSAAALCHLKENSSNFRTILDEVKKAK